MADIEKWTPPFDNSGHLVGKISPLESALLQLQDHNLRGKLDEKISTETSVQNLKELQRALWRFISQFDVGTILAPGFEDRSFEGRGKDVALLLALFSFAGTVLPVGARDPLAQSEHNVKNRETRDQVRNELERIHANVTRRLLDLDAHNAEGPFSKLPSKPKPRTFRGK